MSAIKSLAALVVMFAVVATVAIVPGAASADQSNTNTGFKSLNKNVLKVKVKDSFKLKNSAKVKNSLTVFADTGNNTQEKNTSSGDLDTGNVGVVAGATNIVNQGEVSVPGCDTADWDGNQTNDETGAKSTNKNVVKITDSCKTKVKNSAKVKNDVYVDGNTGGNTQSKNTSSGDIDTGDVDVDFTFNNTVN